MDMYGNLPTTLHIEAPTLRDRRVNAVDQATATPGP
jgi:hypothetical protein